MNYRLFITASFKEDRNKSEIEELCKLVDDAGFSSFCFIRDIEHYSNYFSSSIELMCKAKEEIAKSDALLLQVDNTPTGRLIEAGIAYTLGKPIITISSTDITLKNTIKGITSVLIRYKTKEDLGLMLRSALDELKHKQLLK